MRYATTPDGDIKGIIIAEGTATAHGHQWSLLETHPRCELDRVVAVSSHRLSEVTRDEARALGIIDTDGYPT